MCEKASIVQVCVVPGRFFFAIERDACIFACLAAKISGI